MNNIVLEDSVTGVETNLGGSDGAAYVASALRTIQTTHISVGETNTPGVDLHNRTLLGIIMPSGWDAASLQLEVSVDAGDWFTNLFDSANSPVGVWSSFTLGGVYALDPLAMLPYQFIRFRSGTAGSPVIQTAQRNFILITRSVT